MKPIEIFKEKDALFFDMSYVIFYRYYASLAWYKINNKDTEIDIAGLITNSLFIEKYEKMLLKCIEDLMNKYQIDPTSVYLVMDGPRANIWRQQYYDGYKGTRDEKSRSLNKDIFACTYETILPKLLSKYPMQTVKSDGLEADDIIAIMSKIIKARAPANKRYIITNDNDYIQLCIDDDNMMIVNLQGIAIKDRVGQEPERYLKLKVLMGDKSDNIPSIAKKVGPKTALKFVNSPELLTQFFEKHPSAKAQYELNALLIDFNKIPEKLKLEFETNIIIV